MNYVYSGKIEVWNIPKETDAIREAINKLIEEETYKDWTDADGLSDIDC